jgi:hypothetical protein
MDIEAAKCVLPNRDNEEPTIDMCRNESELPRWETATTARAEPIRTKLRRESEAP